MIAHKAHRACRRLADRHYSRQKPGTPQFCRPGYNLVLYGRDDRGGEAVWVWWRPRWDVGRADGLHAIECTLFRNESNHLSSELIRQACACLLCWHPSPTGGVAQHAGASVITSINSAATEKRRGRGRLAGHCFRAAGWVDFEKRSGRADVWLRCPPSSFPPPCHWRPAYTNQLALFQRPGVLSTPNRAAGVA